MFFKGAPPVNNNKKNVIVLIQGVYTVQTVHKGCTGNVQGVFRVCTARVIGCVQEVYTVQGVYWDYTAHWILRTRSYRGLQRGVYLEPYMKGFLTFHKLLNAVFNLGASLQ